MLSHNWIEFTGVNAPLLAITPVYNMVVLAGRLSVATPLASVPSFIFTIRHDICELLGAANIYKSYHTFVAIVNHVEALVADVPLVRNDIAPLSAASTQNHTVLLDVDGSAVIIVVEENIPPINLPPLVHVSIPHLA